MNDTLLELAIQGNIVLPDGVLQDGFVGVQEGRIAGIFHRDAPPSATHTIDGRGHWVLPGAIDAHVHCYSAPQEGFLHATRSAAAGGVTTLIDMPYDAGAPVMSAERLEAKKQLLAGQAVVDVALLATIRKRGGLDEIPRMAAAGACGFKLSLFDTHPERFPQIPDAELLAAFQRIKETGLTVGVHAENDDVVQRALEAQRQSGNSGPAAHTESRPRVAESEATLRAMEFAHAAGVRLHIHHATFPRVFELVDWYRKQGVDVTAETCTHYLVLTEDDVHRQGARVKVNPPLRSAAERDALWPLCAAGLVDMVTSDHAPWTLDRKSHAHMLDNASGMPGVETLLPVLYSEGVAAGRITISDLARLLSENPARRYRLFPRKGQIRVGADADLVIIDPDAQWILDEAHQRSTAGWSPYHGHPMRGRITHTLLRGEVVYDGENVLAEPGYGCFVPPVLEA